MESGESKTRIVRATLDLLSQSGLLGVGINQVVAESGTPKGSIYYYFPGGKLELAAAALEESRAIRGALVPRDLSTARADRQESGTALHRCREELRSERVCKGVSGSCRDT